MNEYVLTPEVQSYLRSRLAGSPSAVALGKSPFRHVSASALAEQLDGMQRSKFKLPRWHDTPGIYYPKKLSLEQASSELTAQYKARILGENKHVVDITGGFGIDAFYFSQVASSVTAVERSPLLHTISKHNMQVLQASNVTCLAGDGVTHVLEAEANIYHTIYLDPSRRVQGQKVFQLRDCEPDIEALHAALLEKAAQIIVKAAPMLDIHAALNQVSHVAEVHVVSVSNDCKELLFVLKRGYSAEPKIIASILHADPAETSTFPFYPSEESKTVATFNHPQQYLYEPDAALLKSGAYKLLSARFGFDKLHPNTHLYTSDIHNAAFPGRTFRIEQTISYAHFKKDKTKQAGNITTRNFPLKADELRRRHRIAEQQDRFLFFATDSNGDLIVIFASK